MLLALGAGGLDQGRFVELLRAAQDGAGDLDRVVEREPRMTRGGGCATSARRRPNTARAATSISSTSRIITSSNSSI